jgi:valyl-tRNA synthetase
MPFITEELWHNFRSDDSSMIIAAEWPKLIDRFDSDAKAEMDWVIRLITSVRSMRTEIKVPDATVIPLLIKNPGTLETTCIDLHAELIKRIARLEELKIFDDEVPEGAAQVVLGTTTLVFPLASRFNVDEEKARLEKEILRLGDEIDRITNKLSNKNFIEKAPKKVVEDEKVKRDEYERSLSKVQEALESFV